MNEQPYNKGGKGTCPKHGPYIWKHDPQLGICITEHIRKEDTKFPSPCTNTNKKGPRDKGLTELFGGL